MTEPHCYVKGCSNRVEIGIADFQLPFVLVDIDNVETVTYHGNHHMLPGAIRYACYEHSRNEARDRVIRLEHETLIRLSKAFER